MSHRPAYHYTPARNFMNDPNGLVWAHGRFHLFHQYNPFGDVWGHMAWNHATSPDLVHWTEEGVALWEEDGVAIFSGSAVWDRRDTSGLGAPGQPPLVAVTTGHRNADHHEAPCLAVSVDRGRTWTKFPGNPVLDWEPDFRDPKVFWHAPTRRWVMAIVKAAERRLRLYTSPNLRDWTLASTFGPEGVPADRIPNWECPDLFELPVDGEPGATRWVLHVGMGHGHPAGGSGGQYFVGTFDGVRFVNDNPPETVLWADHGADDYAAVSWDGRTGARGERFWIGWMSDWRYANAVPTHPWRNGTTLPRRLSLRRFPEGLRLVARPVPALRALRGPLRRRGPRLLPAGATVDLGPEMAGDALEIRAVFAMGDADAAGLSVRRGPGGEETRIGIDARRGTLFVDRTRSGRCDFHPGFAARHDAPLRVGPDGVATLHLFVDRASVEVFADDGASVLTDLIFPSPESRGVALFAEGGAARLRSLRLWPLRPASPEGI